MAMSSVDMFSFQDYPAEIQVPVHSANQTTIPLSIESPQPEEHDAPAPEKNHNFWTVEYYQKYFDVDTEDVATRIISSMMPYKISPNYFDNTIRHKPDLYGPFWISTTLIFVIGISGNITNYIQHANDHYQWRYDFHLVSYAATAIFCYVCLVPLGLWAALKWTIEDNPNEIINEEDKIIPPSIISLFCLYGYSIFIYIPVSFLWTIQVSWFQWCLVLAAALLSGLVLVYLLMPALKKSRFYIWLIGGILGFHFLLATGFMLYFFHVPK